MTPRVGRRQIESVLQRAWLKRGGLACLLWPVSVAFGLAGAARRQLYRNGFFHVTRVGVPVLVVGNVVAGGAGKTPLVIALARHFAMQGIRVGVLSRGYGRSGGSCLEVRAETPVLQSGDEAALIRRATGAPVFVARKRVDAALALLAAYPKTQLLLCDDGMQHYALARDVEIAVFNDRGVGNGWLLPAGPLREPWPKRLKGGVDLVLHTGNAPAFEGYTAARRLADQAVAGNGSKVQLSSLEGSRLIALAAVANPDAFFAMLRSRGLLLEQTISLPDHYDFSSYVLPDESGVTVLCTEKDAVKLFGLSSSAFVRLLAVPLEFVPEPAFLTAVDALTAPLLSHLPSSHGH